MRTYYSILSVMIRPEIEEKISLGLLLVSVNEVFLNISKTKLSAAKDLLPEHLYQGVRNEIKSIQNTYLSIKNNLKSNQLFGTQESIIQENYIAYLSSYKNNIVVFSQPTHLSITADVVIFDKLYGKYVDEKTFALATEEETKSIERFRHEYVPSLKQHYNPHFIVGREVLPNVIMPLKMDLVGKNDVYVFAKSIDLERRRYNVEHDVNAFYPLKDLSPTSHKFLISKEPEKQYTEQHQIWNYLRTAPWLEYVDVSETERLLVYAQEHGVSPVFGDSTL